MMRTARPRERQPERSGRLSSDVLRDGHQRRPPADPRTDARAVPTRGLAGGRARTAFRTGEVDARRLADAIPDARVVPIPGPDHSPFVGVGCHERGRALPRLSARSCGTRSCARDGALYRSRRLDGAHRISWETGRGVRCWRSTIALFAVSSRSTEESRSTRRAMGSSAASTVRPVRSPARNESSTALASWSSRSARVSTRESARSSEQRSLGSLLRPARGSRALAEPGEVLVSRTVRDLVAGSGIEFVDRGEHALKGVPGTWQLFAVEGRRATT